MIFCRAVSYSSQCNSEGEAMDISSESTEENAEPSYRNIIFEASASIGEPDAVYGAGVSTELKSRIHTYEQENQWGKALRKFGVLFNILHIKVVQKSRRFDIQISYYYNFNGYYRVFYRLK